MTTGLLPALPASPEAATPTLPEPDARPPAGRARPGHHPDPRPDAPHDAPVAVVLDGEPAPPLPDAAGGSAAALVRSHGPAAVRRILRSPTEAGFADAYGRPAPRPLRPWW